MTSKRVDGVCEPVMQVAGQPCFTRAVASASARNLSLQKTMHWSNAISASSADSFTTLAFMSSGSLVADRDDNGSITL